MRIQRFVVHASLLAAGLLTILFVVSEAYASGPGEGGRRIRLDSEPVGPYLLRVVTSPTPPRVENYNVEMRVSDAETGEVLTDVSVSIVAVPVESQNQPITEQATHDYAPIPTEYAAHIPVYQSGLWEITVHVEGERGSGEVTFLERISKPLSLGWIVAIGPPVAGLAILSIVFLKLQRNAKRPRENGG